ncbi:MAG: RHS repeat-associated core domain-containing protein, partial [Gemmatimonadaceae bacterium]
TSLWSAPQTVIPHRNWRGLPEFGSFDTGTKRRCTNYSDPATCIVIDWPAPHLSAFNAISPVQNYIGPPAWFGHLIPQMRGATGQQYKRNRYYDPGTGRFTQEDPIGLAGGMNLYGYAAGDPVNYSDPFGLCPPPISCRLLLAAGTAALADSPLPGPGDAVAVGLALTAGALTVWHFANKNEAKDDPEDKPAPAPPPADTPTNPDGSPKERGQQYEEITQRQRQVRRQGRGERIRSTEKSKQRDRRELQEEAEEALEEQRRRRTNDNPQ